MSDKKREKEKVEWRGQGNGGRRDKTSQGSLILINAKQVSILKQEGTEIRSETMVKPGVICQ